MTKLTRHLFNAFDDRLLNYLNEEGQQIEPEWYSYAVLVSDNACVLHVTLWRSANASAQESVSQQAANAYLLMTAHCKQQSMVQQGTTWHSVSQCRALCLACKQDQSILSAAC